MKLTTAHTTAPVEILLAVSSATVMKDILWMLTMCASVSYGVFLKKFTLYLRPYLVVVDYTDFI